jgi:hypothetical protein
MVPEAQGATFHRDETRKIPPLPPNATKIVEGLIFRILFLFAWILHPGGIACQKRKWRS